MLEYNEITVHKFIIFEGQPYEVLDSHVFRKQQRKPVNAVKMRNLITGNVKEISFHVSEKVEEADLEKKEAKYLYSNRGQHWFREVNDPSKRFELSEALVGEKVKFLKGNSIVKTLLFGDQTIGVEVPIKVDLKVVEAPDAVRGDTAKGGNKQIKLETGAVINAPMFIKEGEIVRINTETGEYVERVGGNKF
ncbi:elongation factor P [Candidatus Parcubacteria bacterium]|nr:elongation factor P [Candidatus Parcubacteria bacterium]